MIYNIDHLSMTRSSWRIVGWVVRADTTLIAATLVVTIGTLRTQRILSVGRYRADVEANLKRSGATSYNGFEGFGAGSIERPDRVELEMKFDNGVEETLDIGRFRNGASAVVARMRTRLNSAKLLARRGHFRDLARRASSAILKDFAAYTSGMELRPLTKPLQFDGPVRLIVDHAMGGGASLFAEKLSREAASSGQSVCFLRYSLQTLQFDLEFRTGSTVYRSSRETIEQVAGILTNVQLEEIHVNNTVSFPNNHTLLKLIQTIKHGDRIALYFYFHDFYPVCPSFTLLDHRGEFCGLPNIEVCSACLRRHNDPFVLSQQVATIQDWRYDWSSFFNSAKQIRFFSRSSYEIFQRAFPEFDPSKCLARLIHTDDGLCPMLAG